MVAVSANQIRKCGEYTLFLMGKSCSFHFFHNYKSSKSGEKNFSNTDMHIKQPVCDIENIIIKIFYSKI